MDRRHHRVTSRVAPCEQQGATKNPLLHVAFSRLYFLFMFDISKIVLYFCGAPTHPCNKHLQGVLWC